MTCAASFLLQRALIENGEFENIESEYAKLGTAAHELCAKAVGTATEPFEFLGKISTGILAGPMASISMLHISISTSA